MKKVIIAITLVFLGVGGFFSWKSFDSTNIAENNFSIIRETASDEEKSHWLVYSNKTAKYSFQHPAGLEIDEKFGTEGRAVHFKSLDPNMKIAVMIFYQDIFEDKSVMIRDYAQFKKEVGRRSVHLFPEREDIVSHETSFAGKQAIVIEEVNTGGREIFVWHGDRVLEIEVVGGMQDEALLSKIFSTFELL